jgi:hypothetical protein
MLDDIVGKRIRLVEMTDDPCPIPAGTEGTVTGMTEVLSSTQLTVKWDINKTLCLVCPPDRYEIIG